MGVDIKYSYPNNPNFKYEPHMEVINMDDDKLYNILYEHGFVVNGVQSSFKKDLKNPNGIFSTKYGGSLSDVNAFDNRYACECRATNQRVHNGAICPHCGTKVKYIDDDLNIFGWMTINDYYIIHPNLFKAIASYIGPKKFEKIIGYEEKKDQNGHKVIVEFQASEKKEDKYNGLGLIDFKEKFDEIMDFFYTPKKKDKFEHIMNNREKIFIQSISIFSTILRPFEVTSDKFVFEDTNRHYHMMTKLVTLLNDKYIRSSYGKRTKNQLLYDLCLKYQDLYGEIENILSGKKGQFRQCFGGRCAFSNRDVIVPNWRLRIDECILPYQAAVELLQQRIVNILQKMYSISYSDAYDIWMKAQLVVDDRVVKIIRKIIDVDQGIKILINRNPTINYGSILYSKVIDISFDYSLQIPLGILTLLAADFDGDVLNVLLIINEDFKNQAERILNPRNAMYVSKNDGKLDSGMVPNKDTLINLNSLLYMSRKNYTDDQVEKILLLKAM